MSEVLPRKHFAIPAEAVRRTCQLGSEPQLSNRPSLRNLASSAGSTDVYRLLPSVVEMSPPGAQDRGSAHAPGRSPVWSRWEEVALRPCPHHPMRRLSPGSSMRSFGCAPRSVVCPPPSPLLEVAASRAGDCGVHPHSVPVAGGRRNAPPSRETSSNLHRRSRPHHHRGDPPHPVAAPDLGVLGVDTRGWATPTFHG